MFSSGDTHHFFIFLLSFLLQIRFFLGGGVKKAMS